MMSNNSSYAMIDQLKMESLIGRGMGDIWRATHTRDGAKVAERSYEKSSSAQPKHVSGPKLRLCNSLRALRLSRCIVKLDRTSLM